MSNDHDKPMSESELQSFRDYALENLTYGEVCQWADYTLRTIAMVHRQQKKEFCDCGCDGNTSDVHLPEPMTDGQIRRWKETGEGYHTDEIADELLRLRAEVAEWKKAANRHLDELYKLRPEVESLEQQLDYEKARFLESEAEVERLNRDVHHYSSASSEHLEKIRQLREWKHVEEYAALEVKCKAQEAAREWYETEVERLNERDATMTKQRNVAVTKAANRAAEVERLKIRAARAEGTPSGVKFWQDKLKAHEELLKEILLGHSSDGLHYLPYKKIRATLEGEITEPMSNECTCADDKDCERCQHLYAAGDKFLEFNDAKQVALLVQERDALRARVKRLQEVKQ